MILSCFLNVVAAILLFVPGDRIFYRSPGLQELYLNPVAGQFHMPDDADEKVQISAMTDSDGVLYWYRRINTPVCQTGECKLIDVGLFWDCTGDFLGLEVYGEHLTKTDHSNFSEADYARLMEILVNDWSILREYDFGELTDGTTEKPGGAADATSGATRKEIASEAVKDAVYTTYTLWHLVHDGEKEKLMALTVDQLLHDSLRVDLLESGKKKYHLFLMDLFAQSKIDQDENLMRLILRELESAKDPDLVNVALKALARADASGRDVQLQLAQVYVSAPDDLRLRILIALQNTRPVSEALYRALEDDLRVDNDWYNIRILDVLHLSTTHSAKVIAAAQKLAQSPISHIKVSADKFLEKIRRKE